MTIAMRLALSFGGILLLMVALTLFGVQRVEKINQTLSEINEVNSVKQRYAINFRGSVHDRAIALRDVTLVPDIQSLPEILNDIKRLEDFYLASKKPMDDLFIELSDVAEAEKRLLSTIHDVERRAQPMAQEVIRLRQQGDQAASQALLLEKMSPAFVEWLASINAFIDYQEMKNQKATAYARDVASGFAVTMILLTLLAIVIGSVMAWYISSYLRKSLGGEPVVAADIVSRIACGDLTEDIIVTQSGSMLAAVSGMQKQLSYTLKQVIEGAKTVSDKSIELERASEEALHASETQASSAITSAASIEELTVSLSSVAQTVEQTEQNSERTATISAEGARLVKNAAMEMAEVAKTVKESASQISSLQQRSKDIAGIASVIGGIAEQTNLLALNAAIEAARAGESGRGFAVVADEVRQLAERTSKATTEIAGMIEHVQTETLHAVRGMETSAPRVTQGLALANQAADMLEQIERQAEDSLNNVRNVSQATSEQSRAIVELAKNIEYIASVSRQTADEMRKNRFVVSALQEVSVALSNQVSKFKV
ncbi:methyl-accepting chemotaxis protein [Shewanella litorisediminis]|uniref:Methyl-accepting chemotaxis protein n=1 Tax=Shewanella litorisediminis TaxID=1173586 RepID=A0ABX7G7H4_9GAMM|nr:methyl-accepting chemotaxis protein [Shewanella litorisediminis]MCL2919739.1 methyl-accepting chemotaxis protein [Shewanella litorisediminis]QRH03317.1 methyl-accepting chemotaxis protein [Shewanella litorisediminis]